MIKLDRLKDGKRHAVTFSYDDGPENDRLLTEIFNSYNMKATFHLNSNSPSLKFPEIYANHEISCHGTYHASMNVLPLQNIYPEIFENKMLLEGIAGYIVRGLSYANGAYTPETLELARSCGIVYSRTTKATKAFRLPDDFMQWHPTCHHRDGIECAQKFIDSIHSYYAYPKVLYIWGHSFEFTTQEEWAVIKKICDMTAGNDEIWYATNIEIYDYVQAAKSLIVSADNHTVYNPTCTDVWFSNDGDVYKICGGETLHI